MSWLFFIITLKFWDSCILNKSTNHKSYCLRSRDVLSRVAMCFANRICSSFVWRLCASYQRRFTSTIYSITSQGWLRQWNTTHYGWCHHRGNAPLWVNSYGWGVPQHQLDYQCISKVQHVFTWRILFGNRTTDAHTWVVHAELRHCCIWFTNAFYLYYSEKVDSYNYYIKQFY